MPSRRPGQEAHAAVEGQHSRRKHSPHSSGVSPAPSVDLSQEARRVVGSTTEAHNSTTPTNNKQLSVPDNIRLNDKTPSTTSSPPSPPPDNGLTPTDSSASSARSSASRSPDRFDHRVPLFNIDRGAADHCEPTAKHGGQLKGGQQRRPPTKCKPRKLAGAPRLPSSHLEAKSMTCFRDKLKGAKFVSEHILQAMHHTWATTPEMIAFFRKWSPEHAISNFISHICSSVVADPEPARGMTGHYRQESLAMFHKYIVEALGLQFSRTEIRDELFNQWLALRSSFFWFVSLDARVELFLKGLRIDGRVWSMAREGARYDAEYVAPESYIVADFYECDDMLDGQTFLRHISFSATFPLEDEWWGEDAEGSFSWYVKHVAKVAAVHGKEHRAELVEQYCDWCEQEEFKEQWIFVKRYARRWFPGANLTAVGLLCFQLSSENHEMPDSLNAV